LPLVIGIGCGYSAHLHADACTPHGAPLFLCSAPPQQIATPPDPTSGAAAI